MATTATRRPPARKRPAAKKPAARAGTKAKQAGVSAKSKAKPSVAKQATEAIPTPSGLAGKLAARAARKAARKVAASALESGAEVIRHFAEKAAATGSEVVERSHDRRLPIQRSVDVAVPVRVAWEEWMTLETLPEGVHTVTEIERDGAVLTGRTSGPRPADWEAEVLDERERQSFAWQSHAGSDCAGLITFHELSRRLTRIELNLDVVPTSVAETVLLSTRLADHRAELELRRFKARLELINPDLYDQDELDDEHPQDEETDGTGGEQDQAAEAAEETRNGG